jgi:hypothetical protein
MHREMAVRPQPKNGSRLARLFAPLAIAAATLLLLQIAYSANAGAGYALGVIALLASVGWIVFKRFSK